MAEIRWSGVLRPRDSPPESWETLYDGHNGCERRCYEYIPKRSNPADVRFNNTQLWPTALSFGSHIYDELLNCDQLRALSQYPRRHQRRISSVSLPRVRY